MNSETSQVGKDIRAWETQTTKMSRHNLMQN